MGFFTSGFSETSEELGIRLEAELRDVAINSEIAFKAKSSLIYLRSVARAVAKGLSTHQLKKKVDSGGVEGWLKKAAVDVGSDITENADLRCSHFLPGKIFIGDFPIQPGAYDLTIDFMDYSNHIIKTQHVSQYHVRVGDFNLVNLFSIALE